MFTIKLRSYYNIVVKKSRALGPNSTGAPYHPCGLRDSECSTSTDLKILIC